MAEVGYSHQGVASEIARLEKILETLPRLQKRSKFLEKRLLNIKVASEQCKEAGYYVPKEWIDEQRELETLIPQLKESEELGTNFICARR